MRFILLTLLAHDEPIQRTWTEDRAYDLPLGGRVRAKSGYGTFSEGGITRKLKGRTGSGSFTIEWVSENQDTRCNSQGTCNLHWVRG